MIRWEEPEEVTDKPDEAINDLEEDDEFDEGEWELDPNDPTHPDHDLSDSASYMWEPPDKPFYLRRGVILFVTILIILGLLIPTLARIT